MKSTHIISILGLFALLIAACAPPAENKERTAACKEAGNSKMCGICCKTKSGVYTTTGVTGTCTCFGDLEK
jgi:hypothetical protein